MVSPTPQKRFFYSSLIFPSLRDNHRLLFCLILLFFFLPEVFFMYLGIHSFLFFVFIAQMVSYWTDFCNLFLLAVKSWVIPANMETTLIFWKRFLPYFLMFLLPGWPFSPWPLFQSLLLPSFQFLCPSYLVSLLLPTRFSSHSLIYCSTSQISGFEEVFCYGLQAHFLSLYWTSYRPPCSPSLAPSASNLVHWGYLWKSAPFLLLSLFWVNKEISFRLHFGVYIQIMSRPK